MALLCDQKNDVLDLQSRKRHTRNPVVYFLQNGNRSYIGMTINLRKRMKQHRRILAGGAKATNFSDQSKTQLVAFISGFETINRALSYEWHCKRKTCPPKLIFPATHTRFCRFFEPLLLPKFQDLHGELTVFLVKHHEIDKLIIDNYPMKQVVLCTEP